MLGVHTAKHHMQQ